MKNLTTNYLSARAYEYKVYEMLFDILTFFGQAQKHEIIQNADLKQS